MTGQSESLSTVVFKPPPAQLQLHTTLGPPGQPHPGRLLGGGEHRQAQEKKILIIVPILVLILILTVSTNPHNCLIRFLTEPKIQVPQFLTGANTTLSKPDTQCGDGDYLGRTLFPTSGHQIVIRSFIINLHRNK